MPANELGFGLLHHIYLFSLGDVTVLTTKDVYNYKFMWIPTHRTMFTFRLQACKDVYLLLAKTPYVSDKDVYEIRMMVNGQAKTEV